MPWDQLDQDQHLWASQLVIILLSQLEENTDIFYNLAPHHFDMGIDVDVAFLRNGAPLASIAFKVSLPLEIRVLWKEIFVASKIWDIFH